MTPQTRLPTLTHLLTCVYLDPTPVVINGEALTALSVSVSDGVDSATVACLGMTSREIPASDAIALFPDVVDGIADHRTAWALLTGQVVSP